MKNTIVLALLILSFSQLNAQCPVLPAPGMYNTYPGSFDCSKGIKIDTTGLDQNAFDYFSRAYYAIHGGPVILSKDKDAIRFKPNTEENLSKPEQLYLMSLLDGENVIYYSSKLSQHYALVSLLQLIETNENGKKYIRNCKLGDNPRFSWRGMHLDVSRHFFDVDKIEQFLDLMAFYKFNKFHWHLTDDQGWRIEIKKYPELTKIGGKRYSTMKGHYNDEPREFDNNTYQGYYTQDEIKHIVDYAAKIGIEVIPEIEMPGHARAALAAYPQYSCTGEFQEVPGTWGVFEDIFCSKEETITFLKDILSEVIELFPSKYIHIGGDEAPKTRWEQCENCQNVMSNNNLEDEHQLQSYFIRQMDDFLTAHGKSLIGWDEILEGGLSPNATVMSWRGTKGGIEAIKQNHDVIMSPTSHCYFDYYQSNSANEPLAIGGYLPINKVYAFNPIPEGVGLSEASHILGGQANLWTEYIGSFHQLQYMAFPRAIAMSQVLWSVSKPEFSTFIQVLHQYHEPILKRLNINYSQSMYLPQFDVEATEKGVNLIIRGIDETRAYDAYVKVLGPMPFVDAHPIRINDTLTFERKNDQNVNSCLVKITDVESQQAIQKRLIQHSGLGYEVIYETAPSEVYSTSKSTKLTDGMVGNRPWNGSDWIGFNTDEVTLVMDLNDKQFIDSVSVSALDANGSWIYLPNKITVRRKGLIFWRKVGVAKTPEELTTIKIGKTTTKLKFEFDMMDKIPDGKEGAGYQPWLFLDELMLYSK